ncbi:hypothetical protein F5Y09DRAFT_11034 [Xylaria sp. FL1042]|nr:hypothetical protein F5Y09DRAFT_11034 [Xylaria sp. FL1042]
MRCFLILWLATLLRVVAENQFISPRNHSANGPGTYTANARWSLGSSQLVAFQTDWKEYRIELWQQSLTSGAEKSANLIYNQNERQDLPQSFYWTVQTYEFLLSDSPVFFFELQDNNNPTARQISPFFNITIVHDPATGSSTALTTPSISTTSTISTETSYPASSPSEHVIITQGLSAGAMAAIGVCVSLVVVIIASIAAGFVFLRRRRQGQQQPVELPSHEL